VCVSEFRVGTGFGEYCEAGHFALYYGGRKTFGVALGILKVLGVVAFWIL